MIPKQPGGAPEISELTAVYPDKTADVRIQWRANKLASATLHLQAEELDEKVELPGFSDGFSYRFKAIGPVSGKVTVELKDLDGKTSKSASVNIKVPAKAE